MVNMKADMRNVRTRTTVAPDRRQRLRLNLPIEGAGTRHAASIGLIPAWKNWEIGGRPESLHPNPVLFERPDH